MASQKRKPRKGNVAETKSAGPVSGKNARTLKISVSIAVVIILVVVAFYAYGQTGGMKMPSAGDVTPSGQLGEIAEDVEECVSDNPSLTQEQCWDLRYHDTAIESNDPSLCSKILSSKIKAHCEKYFK